MKQEFLMRVYAEGVVDTKKYRYKTVWAEIYGEQRLQVVRLPLEYLDTTAALTEWEVVETL